MLGVQGQSFLPFIPPSLSSTMHNPQLNSSQCKSGVMPVHLTCYLVSTLVEQYRIDQSCAPNGR